MYKIITSDAWYDTTNTYAINWSTKIKTYKLSETQQKRSKDKQKSEPIIEYQSIEVNLNF